MEKETIVKKTITDKSISSKGVSSKYDALLMLKLSEWASKQGLNS